MINPFNIQERREAFPDFAAPSPSSRKLPWITFLRYCIGSRVIYVSGVKRLQGILEPTITPPRLLDIPQSLWSEFHDRV